MSRIGIGIGSRLILIVVGSLILMQIFMALAYFAERRHAAGRVAFAPLLDQMAALAQTLDRVPVEDRSLVLRAATSGGYLPRIVQERPGNTDHIRGLRFAERRLRVLLSDTGDRFVSISLIADEQRGGRPIARLRDLVGARVHALISLKSGGYLDIETTGNLAMRLLGIPAGLMAGILSLIVAIVALLWVRRETRPLSELAAAVERFGPEFGPQPVTVRGAPDVRALIRSVNTMQTRIAELVRSRTLVLGAISHDLRTYLTRLRLRLELLPESEQRTKASTDLDGMQALVDDALAFARASFGNAAEETTDFARMVRAEYEARRALTDHVTLTGAETSLMVRGSSTALARVVANLVSNALAYGGRADISVHAEGQFAELCVDDRGPGIPASERANVFEPFYRLEPSRNRESGGTGLGLTIVQQIVESYGGSITIEDRPGGGARVRVTAALRPIR